MKCVLHFCNYGTVCRGRGFDPGQHDDFGKLHLVSLATRSSGTSLTTIIELKDKVNELLLWRKIFTEVVKTMSFGQACTGWTEQN